MARDFTSSTDGASNSSFSGVISSGTISCWIRPHFNSGDSVQRFFWSTGSGDQLSFQRFSDNNIYVGFTSGSDQRIVVSDAGLFTSGTWANWIFTWSNAAGQTAYKNAASVGSHILTFSAPGSAITAGNNAAETNSADAAIADFACWNVILSTGELSALSSGARPYTVRPASLQIYWPFDGLQSPEPDFSGLALNATLAGTAFALGPPTMLFSPRNVGQAILPPPLFGPNVTTTLTNVPARAFTKKHYRDELARIRDEAVANRQLWEGLDDKTRADLEHDAALTEFEELDRNLGVSNYGKHGDAKERLDRARKDRDHQYFMEIVNKEIAKYNESKKK